MRLCQRASRWHCRTNATAWSVIDERIEQGASAPSSDDRWVDLYGGLVEMLGLPFGPQEVAARLARLFRSVDLYEPFDDVGPEVAELADSGLRLAVLSYSDFPLEPILDRCGIGTFVEVAIAADARDDEAAVRGVPALLRRPPTAA